VIAGRRIVGIHRHVIGVLRLIVRPAIEPQLVPVLDAEGARIRPGQRQVLLPSASSVTEMSATLIAPPFSAVELTVLDSTTAVGTSFTSAMSNAGHVSLDRLKVMSAIERCRTTAIGGHVARCEDCSHTLIAYNSCRDRHCPKCQGTAPSVRALPPRNGWSSAKPSCCRCRTFMCSTRFQPSCATSPIRTAVVHDLLFKASAETTLTIAADPKHLGVRIGFISVLHTCGSALVHHPHVYMIVPGGTAKRLNHRGV
jgi:hypothetical protein